MKENNYLPSVILIVVACFLFSCQSDEELLYSCDEKINQFVKDNKLELESMTIEKFNDLSTGIQRGAFNMFCEEKRYSIWLEKYNDILIRNPDGFSTQELNHISELMPLLKVEHFYESITSEEKVSLRRNLKNWGEQGKRDLKWNDLTLRFLLKSFSPSLEEFVDEYYKPVTKENKNNARTLRTLNGEEDCECESASLWLQDCSFAFECDDEADCTATTIGCGIFWLDDCDGECVLI